MSELIFTKDGITVKTQVRTPLVGESLHEEKLAYDKLPVDGIQLTITAIDRVVDPSGNLRALSFKVKDISSSPASNQDQSVTMTLAPSSVKYGFFGLSPESRRLFPGFKIPFVLRDGRKEYTVHVTGGSKGTRHGDPDEGVQIVGGLQEFFENHRLKAGDTIQITTRVPGKIYDVAIPTGSTS